MPCAVCAGCVLGRHWVAWEREGRGLIVCSFSASLVSKTRPHRQFEQQKEDEEKRKAQELVDFDKSWTDETRREGRVGNWRDFQKGPGAKRARVQVGGLMMVVVGVCVYVCEGRGVLSRDGKAQVSGRPVAHERWANEPTNRRTRWRRT